MHAPQSAESAACAAGERLRRRGRLDINVTFAKKDRTGTTPRFAHARAELAELWVRVDHVSLYGLTGLMIVTTVIDGDPKAAKLIGAT